MQISMQMLPLNLSTQKPKSQAPDLSLSSFHFFLGIHPIFTEKSNGIRDLEAKYVIIVMLFNHSTNVNLYLRLNQLGYRIGQRTLELLTLRDGKAAKRETKILGVLQFINTSVWRTLFGKTADGLEKSRDSEYECK